MAGVVERVPHLLREDPVLRVEVPGLVPAEFERGEIDAVDRAEVRPGGHEARVVDELRGCAGATRGLAIGSHDPLPAVEQQPPQRLDVGRAGQATGHADHGDVRLVVRQSRIDGTGHELVSCRMRRR